MTINPYEAPHENHHADDARFRLRSQRARKLYGVSLITVVASVGVSMILFSAPMPGLESAFVASFSVGLVASLCGVLLGLAVGRFERKLPPSLMFHGFVLLLFCGMLVYWVLVHRR